MSAPSGSASPVDTAARAVLGALAAMAGIAAAELVRALLHVRVHPIVAVAETIV